MLSRRICLLVIAALWSACGGQATTVAAPEASNFTLPTQPPAASTVVVAPPSLHTAPAPMSEAVPFELRPGVTSEQWLAQLPTVADADKPIALPHEPDARELPAAQLPPLPAARPALPIDLQRPGTPVSSFRETLASKLALVRLPAADTAAAKETVAEALGAVASSELFFRWYFFELPDSMHPAEVELRLQQTGLLLTYQPNLPLHAKVLWNDPLLQPTSALTSQWAIYNVGQHPQSLYDADIDGDEAWSVTSARTMYWSTVAVADHAPHIGHADAPVYSLACRLSTTLNDLGCYPQQYVNTASHGTRVASLVAAKSGNGYGMAGVNYAAKVMSLDVINNGQPDWYAIINAIRFAVRNGAGVINLSVGTTGPVSYSNDLNDPMWAAIEFANQRDVLVVSAAGNEATYLDCGNQSCAELPANYNNTNQVVVSATNERFTNSSFTNWGTASVDIAAPGVAVASAVNGGGFAVDDGTSYSAPIVAGVMSLIKSLRPLATPYVMQSCLAYTPVAALNGVNRLSGVINAKGAVDCALTFGEQTPPPAFGLLAPASGAAINGLSPIFFSWQPTSDFFVAYDVFIDGQFQLRTYGTSASLMLPDGAHTFFVRATDAYGNWVNSTSSRAFTVDSVPPGPVTLLSPTSATPVTTLAVTFTWQAATGATSYELWVVGTNTRIITSGTSATVSGLTNGWYNWQVTAFDAAGNRTYSNPGLFLMSVTDTTPPPAFALLAPSNNSVVTPTSGAVTFSWQAAPDTGVTYTLYIDSTARGTTSATSLSVAVAPAGHLWWVAAQDATGNRRLSNTSWVVNVPGGGADGGVADSTPPPAFALLTPANAATVANSAVTFTWQAAPDTGVNYLLYVDGVLRGTTGSTAFALGGLSNGAHTWWVYAKDAAGNLRSSTSSFTLSVNAVAADGG